MTPPALEKKWRPKLIIDVDRFLQNKVAFLAGSTRTPEERKRVTELLNKFGITTEKQVLDLYAAYRRREKKKSTISPLERDRVLGPARKRRRLREAFE